MASTAAQNQPKQSPRSEIELSSLACQNEAFSKSLSRIEDLLIRMGHIFPPQPESGKVPLTQIPNGHFGSLHEKLNDYDNLNSRLSNHLDTLETFV